ncbi:MAG: hypothetical protein HZC42_03930 [Candidatus Eisenbacteria bacterium]|nr:hypothetical protein [Candidatus Eisenbacteria bacterium]
MKFFEHEYLAGYNAAVVDACGTVANPDSNRVWIVQLRWTPGSGGAKDVLGLGTGVTGVDNGTDPAPRELALRLARLRPGTGAVGFRVEVPAALHARLDLYDVTGRRVRTVLDGDLPPGESAVEWDGRGSSGAAAGSGIYFARLNCRAGQRTVRVPLLR